MASVTYKIGGKYDGKALKSAKKDLGDLTKVVKGFAVVKVFQGLNKVAQATKGVFVAQNKALTTFNTAVVKSGKSLEKLNELKSQLSKGNFFDDDSLNNAMALGVQMGLTNEQLEKVMKTAADMAASGVMPLDQAVQSLGKSFSGSVGTLSRVAPELANLTKEELANGKAVDILMERYDGFSEAMSNTFSGRNTQFENQVSDLKAAIGSIPQSLEFITQGKLLDPLQNVTEWIVSNRNYIINFFLHLPEVFKTVLTSIGGMVKTFFENFPTWISSIGIYFVDMIKDNLITAFNLAKGVLQGIGELLDFVIGNPFRKSKDFINIMLNNLIEGINKLADKLPGWLKSWAGIEDGNAITYRFETTSSDNNQTWKETAQAIEKSMTNVISTYKEGAAKAKDNWLKIFNSSNEFFSDDIATLKEKLSAILGQDLPEDLQNALDGMTLTVDPSTTDSGDTDSTDIISAIEETGEKVGDKIKSGVLEAVSVIGSALSSSTGEFGSFVTSIVNNGIWGAIAELLGYIFERIEEVSPIFSWFQEIFSQIFEILIDEDSGILSALENFLQPFLDGFNAVADILVGFLQFIAGILNAIKPVLDGLTTILNRVAPIIAAILEVLGLLFEVVGVIGDMLNPILEVVMQILAPILEVINIIIRAIYKIIATIVNWIIDIYNAITWGKNKSHISTELSTTGSSLTGYTSYTPDLTTTATDTTVATTSGSASYTAAKDIYVNIYYNNSYVNGDAREIALNIRDEIRSAEKLGY